MIDREEWLMRKTMRQGSPYKPRVVRDLDAHIETYLSYSDPRAKKQIDVFGEKENGLMYDYSDRLVEWNYDKAQAAWKSAEERVGNTRCARFFQEYLSAYHGKPVEIRHIVLGVNHSNGYDYKVYGYRFTKSA